MMAIDIIQNIILCKRKFYSKSIRCYIGNDEYVRHFRYIDGEVKMVKIEVITKAELQKRRDGIWKQVSSKKENL